MSQSFTLSARVLLVVLCSSNGSLLFAKVEVFQTNNYGPLDSTASMSQSAKASSTSPLQPRSGFLDLA